MTRPIQFGIDRLLADPVLRRPLAGKRVALLAHPASVTADLTHSLDALAALPDLRLSAAFGPQHGLRGDKQDNMVESPDFRDPQHGIPVFSLYGEVRRPATAMMDSFDVLLVDLQDLGCRIYTFITTLRYVLEAAAEHGKTVWVLDRPNPAGRPVEGLTLRDGWESFVGAGPLPMRHGLTMGELGHWFIATLKLDVDYRVIEMSGWQPDVAPGYGWPLGERTWINPSPNAPNLWMARAYAGTVMLEGTTLSEGRGTTRPLEIFGAPDIDARAVLAEMRTLAPHWLAGCRLREIWFEPTFHKHAGKLCSGIQIHVDGPWYDHAAFRPWRLQALAFKAIRRLYPDYPLWRDFAYEYEHDRLAIDLINGSPLLREWVNDSVATPGDLDRLAWLDESAWSESQQQFLSYGNESNAFNHPTHSIQVAEPDSNDENVPDHVWVGARYEACGNRILVLGESWYGTREEYAGDLITDHGWITAYLNNEMADPLYTRIANSVEQNQQNAKRVFWNRVAFTNLVRHSVGPDRNSRPSEDDYRSAIPRLRQLLAELKPRGVLILGTRQSNFSGPSITEFGALWESVRHPTGEYGVRNQEIREAWERLLSRLPQP